TGAPPLVLVHGAVMSSRYMIPTAELLASEQPVYAPDLPGYGKSDKPPRALSLPEMAEALAAWMGVNGLERAALLGNSMGCQVIAHLAVRHPALVDRAVLLGPTIDARARSFPRQLVRWLLDVPREAPSQGLVLLRDLWDCGPLRAAGLIRQTLRDRIEEQLPHMRAPTLVVRGARDPLVPQPWAEEVARLLPHGQLLTLPSAAHTPNYGAPLALVRALRPFLQADNPGREHQSGHGRERLITHR
ncbi:MAG TPA: alpha/beta hydrolase, partial [Roseiflexaceae bacterium]|nr:alpha/beta hydrolase [Roseiflexaceae bacterium]